MHQSEYVYSELQDKAAILYTSHMYVQAYNYRKTSHKHHYVSKDAAGPFTLFSLLFPDMKLENEEDVSKSNLVVF